MKENDLQRFKINGDLVSNDLFGKKGAIHELEENKTDLIISVSKLIGIFSLFIIPTLLLLFLLTIIVWLTNYTLKEAMRAYMLITIMGFIVSFAVTMTLFFESDKEDATDKSIFKKELEKISELWLRRKELLRYINVESELFENSQAQEIAPWLNARIKKHNQNITDSFKLINLQHSLDLNSSNKRAPELTRTITEKLKREHEDLKNRLLTYAVMRDMKSDQPLGITTSLMTIEDLNKSDLDKYLEATQDSIGILLDDSQEQKVRIV